MSLIDRQLLEARRLGRRAARLTRRQKARETGLQAASPVCAMSRQDVGRLVARAALEAGRGDVQAMAILKAAGMTPTAITQTLGELRRDLAVARTVGVKL